MSSVPVSESIGGGTTAVPGPREGEEVGRAEGVAGLSAEETKVAAGTAGKTQTEVTEEKAPSAEKKKAPAKKRRRKAPLLTTSRKKRKTPAQPRGKKAAAAAGAETAEAQAGAGSEGGMEAGESPLKAGAAMTDIEAAPRPMGEGGVEPLKGSAEPSTETPTNNLDMGGEPSKVEKIQPQPTTMMDESREGEKGPAAFSEIAADAARATEDPTRGGPAATGQRAPSQFTMDVEKPAQPGFPAGGGAANEATSDTLLPSARDQARSDRDRAPAEVSAATGTAGPSSLGVSQAEPTRMPGAGSGAGIPPAASMHQPQFQTQGSPFQPQTGGVGAGGAGLGGGAGASIGGQGASSWTQEEGKRREEEGKRREDATTKAQGGAGTSNLPTNRINAAGPFTDQ